jgi:hypothetical protein
MGLMYGWIYECGKSEDGGEHCLVCDKGVALGRNGL